MAVLHKICREPHRPAWEINPDVPDEMSDVIDRLLEKVPQRRYDSAEQLQAALTRLLATLQEAGPRRRRSRYRRWARGHRSTLCVASAGLAGLVATIFALVQTPFNEPQSNQTSPQSLPPMPLISRQVPAIAAEISPAAEFKEELHATQLALDRLEHEVAPGIEVLYPDRSAWHRQLQALQGPGVWFGVPLKFHPFSRRTSMIKPVHSLGLLAALIGCYWLIDQSAAQFESRYVASTNQEFVPERSVIVTPAQVELHNKLTRSVGKLRSAEDESKKEAAKQEVAGHLTQIFESDMQRREAEIAKVEARVKKLRQQLEKRRTAKASIIQLRLQVLVNEAEGLGFIDRPFIISPTQPLSYSVPKDVSAPWPSNPLTLPPRQQGGAVAAPPGNVRRADVRPIPNGTFGDQSPGPTN